MTKTTKTNLSILSLVLFFIMAMASSADHKVFADGDKLIPPDYNPDKGTLLIQAHPLNSKQNDRMIEFLQKNYPHPYEIVGKEEIEKKNGKYADTKKYPFAVVWRESETINTSQNFNGTTSHLPQYDLYGHFVDQFTGKAYPETRKINNYGQIGYVPFFNSIAKHFK